MRKRGNGLKGGGGGSADDRGRAASAPNLLHAQHQSQSDAAVAELGSPGRWSNLLDTSAGDADFADELEGELAAVAAAGAAGVGGVGSEGGARPVL